MSIPAWFNFEHYKAQKLAQLQATDTKGAWTAEKLDSAMTSAGFGGADGYFSHFTQYGADEHCTPNATFNAAEYLAAKLVQLQATDKTWVGKTISEVQAALKAAGLGEWEHYHLYGSKEGVNPSNAFDESAYLTAKLAQLQIVEPEKWAGKDEAAVKAAFAEAGLSSLEHYMLYGKAEALVPVAVPAEEQVTVPSDFNVFGGKGGMPSEGFDLTRGTDTFVGGAGNDSFFAASANGFVTLNPGDSIDGGAGNDTLYIGAGGGVENFSQAKITNIENIQIAGGDIDVSGNADVVRVSNVGFAGKTTVTLKQSIALSGTAAADQEIVFKGATGVEDKASIALSSVAAKGNDLTVGNIEDLTFAVTGKNVIQTITDAELKNLVVKGEGSLKAAVAASAGKVASVDATAAKGGVELTIDGGDLTSDATVKGSDANDAFVFTGALTTQKVDGGSGDDTLTLTDTVINDANKGNFTNFEALVLNASAGNVSYKVGAIEGIKSYKVAANGHDVSLTNATKDVVLDVTKVGATDTTISNLNIAFAESGLHKLELNLDNGGTDTTDDGVIITAMNAGVSSLLLHSNGLVNTTENSVTASGGALASLQEVTIDGSQDLAFVTGISTVLSKIDGSAATGELTITASAATVVPLTISGGFAADTITGATVVKNFIDGGAGDDNIIGGNAGDVLNGGAGNDDITGGSSADVINGGTGNDIIDGKAGADVINGGEGDDTITGGAGIDTITGGAGADTFVYDTVAAATNANNITDFKVAEGDKLHFDHTTFTELAAGADVKFKTAAEANAFAWGSGTADSDNIIVRDTKANIMALNLQTNHSGKIGTLVAFATDTGEIIYDGDGNFTASTEVIGTIGADQVGLLTAGNIVVGS